jgi:hypothetical protein
MKCARRTKEETNHVSSNMPQLLITLTDLQYQCLAAECYDPQEWATNAIMNRVRIAYDALFQAEIQRRFNAGESILPDKDANLCDAFDRGIIQTAKQKAEANSITAMK